MIMLAMITLTTSLLQGSGDRVLSAAAQKQKLNSDGIQLVDFQGWDRAGVFVDYRRSVSIPARRYWLFLYERGSTSLVLICAKRRLGERAGKGAPRSVYSAGAFPITARRLGRPMTWASGSAGSLDYTLLQFGDPKGEKVVERLSKIVQEGLAKQ